MNVKAAALGLLVFLVFLTALLPGAVAGENSARISPEKLLGILDDPSLVILDARLAADWRKSDSKIKGAVRVDPHDVGSWIGDYSANQKIVVYCS